MNDQIIDLHMLFVSELGGTVRSFLKPHRCHRVVSLRKTHYPSTQEDNVVCATNKVSDQPAHTGSLIRAFASPLKIL